MREKLTYSNVMSTVAVFLALGGGSFAIAAALEKNSVKSKQVKDNALKSQDLKDGKGVTGADIAAPEPYHVVGAPGEPAFSDGGDGDCIWSDGFGDDGIYQPPSFYKDATGRVHLEGVVKSADGTLGDDMCDASGGANEIYQDFRVFTLPSDYRPERPQYFQAAVADGIADVSVWGDEASHGVDAGAVLAVDAPPDHPFLFPLSGISFRAADPNSDTP